MHNFHKKIQLAYGHNEHLYGIQDKNFDMQHKYRNWFDILSSNSKSTCEQLLIIDSYQKQLKCIHPIYIDKKKIKRV